LSGCLVETKAFKSEPKPSSLQSLLLGILVGLLVDLTLPVKPASRSICLQSRISGADSVDERFESRSRAHLGFVAFFSPGRRSYVATECLMSIEKHAMQLPITYRLSQGRSAQPPPERNGPDTPLPMFHHLLPRRSQSSNVASVSQFG
jgi:hypothetical protein